MTGLVVADAWRILFLAGSAPVVGSALMILIAGVTGGRWPAAERAARWLPLAAVGAALLGPAQAATPAPPHLALWLNPVAVGARGLVAVAGLWAAVVPLRAGCSPTRAGVTLGLYAWLVTPIASDWMLGQVPGHPVSAAGMMLVCQQVAAATALPLAAGWGDERQRADLVRLMAAAALGLGYLMFVDYLIIWFGNLPARVDFYRLRGGGWGLVPLLPALLLGWAVPLVLLVTGRSVAAGWSVLAAILLVDCWWVGGGPVAWSLAGLGLALVGGGLWWFETRRSRHG